MYIELEKDVPYIRRLYGSIGDLPDNIFVSTHKVREFTALSVYDLDGLPVLDSEIDPLIYGSPPRYASVFHRGYMVGTYEFMHLAVCTVRVETSLLEEFAQRYASGRCPPILTKTLAYAQEYNRQVCRMPTLRFVRKLADGQIELTYFYLDVDTIRNVELSDDRSIVRRICL